MIIYMRKLFFIHLFWDFLLLQIIHFNVEYVIMGIQL